MAVFVKFHCFAEDVAHGVHNLGSDTLKVMLSNTARAAGVSRHPAALLLPLPCTSAIPLVATAACGL